MKKTISLFALTAIAATLFFSGCKKGENDPFLSLKSRTARLAHTWKLSSEDYNSVSTYDGSTTTSHYTYDGTIKTTVRTSGGTTTTNTEAYSQEITFDKDGTYELTVNDDGDIETEKGNWMWTNKIKGQDIKNKEAVVLISTSYSYSDSGSSGSDTYSGKTIDPDEFMVFDKLSSKELVVLLDYKETDSDGYVYTDSGTRTFTKK